MGVRHRFLGHRIGFCLRTVAVVACGLALAGGGAFADEGELSDGFVEEPVAGGWTNVTGLTFDANGRMLVWDKAGRVWIVDNGVKLTNPLIDISEEVGNWRDYGLLGFALDPGFLSNGHIYLLYVVDRHHLLHFGTGGYSPTTDEYFAATIGRITRYTANALDNFETVDYGSRTVLVGETIGTGFPIVHQSHGVGALVFGTDGSLLASCGDGASYSAVDDGGDTGGSYGSQALTDGIISPKQDVGAFRAQMVDSLSGKIIRIDPATGDGLPTNPYWDVAFPRAPRSRMWSSGHRNPYRMVKRPETGSHNLADGDPGVLFIGDVGWGTWEDINVDIGVGLDFGWPIYEGFDLHTGYFDAKTPNLDAPNPLYDGGVTCNQEFFDFQDLLAEDDLSPSWPNPCDGGQQVPVALRQLHRRPAIDFRHGSGPARTGIHDGGGSATTIDIDDPGSPVTGDRFGGNASTGGAFYVGTTYPAELRNAYFHGDYGAGWIRVIEFDSNHDPVVVHRFYDGGRRPVAFAAHPITHDSYDVNYSDQVLRLKYVGDGNLPPKAAVAAEHDSGTAPLEIRFFGDRSVDPENGYLDFQWDFGDGNMSGMMNPIHSYEPTLNTITDYNVTLTITDDDAQSDQTTLLVSLENTPPSVTITDPLDGASFSHTTVTVVTLDAAISDAEDPTPALACEWIVYLHHDDHFHPEPADFNCTTSAVLTPVGCDGHLYYYRAQLKVTDTHGLSTIEEVNVYPDCTGVTLQADAGFDAVYTDDTRDGAETVTLDASGSADPNHTITAYSWRLDDREIASGETANVDLPLGMTVVTLAVSNDVDHYAVDTVRITVNPGSGVLATPEARFTVSSRTGVAPLPVAFDGSISADPDGTVVSYFWDFGGGDTSSEIAPWRVFQDEGEYTVELTVTDDDGLTDTQTMNLVAGPDDLGQGVHYEYYEGTWDVLPDFDGLTPVATGTAANFTIAPRQQDDNFGFRFDSCIEITAGGSYTFYTTSDDGSKLYIDGVEIVDNDGLHGAVEQSGVVSLSSGLYPIRVTFFEKGGGQVLETRYEGPGIGKQLIPDQVLFLDGCSGGPNQRPVAVNDTAETTQGLQIVLTVLDNDSDPDLDSLTVWQVDDPLYGTASTDGTTITYTHDGCDDRSHLRRLRRRL
jgi:PKD repeat protein